jgi:hypothetical protein
MQLVKNWKKGYKWVSLHCMVLATAIQGSWIYIPQDLRDKIPENLVMVITVSLLALGIIGRFVNQTKDDK